MARSKVDELNALVCPPAFAGWLVHALSRGRRSRDILEAEEAVVDLHVTVDKARAMHALEEVHELDREEHYEQLVEARALLHDTSGPGAVDDAEEGVLLAELGYQEAFVAEGA